MKIITLTSLILALVLSAAGAAQASVCGAVSPVEFRAAHTGETRWTVEHRVFHATGHLHARWVGSDGYAHQVRRYQSTWHPGTKVRVTYIRLSGDTPWLLEKEQWCNVNDPSLTNPTPAGPEWNCYDKVYP